MWTIEGFVCLFNDRNTLDLDSSEDCTTLKMYQLLNHTQFHLTIWYLIHLKKNNSELYTLKW